MKEPPEQTSWSHVEPRPLQIPSATSRSYPLWIMKAVTEAVQAVERQPAADLDALAVADGLRAASKLGAVARARERALEDAVVVAGVADARALGERLRDVPVVSRERRRADRVRDPVTVLLDRRRPAHLLLEQASRGVRPLLE